MPTNANTNSNPNPTLTLTVGGGGNCNFPWGQFFGHCLRLNKDNFSKVFVFMTFLNHLLPCHPLLMKSSLRTCWKEKCSLQQLYLFCFPVFGTVFQSQVSTGFSEVLTKIVMLVSNSNKLLVSKRTDVFPKILQNL